MKLVRKILGPRGRRALLSLGALATLAGVALVVVALYSFASDDSPPNESPNVVVDLEGNEIDLDVPQVAPPPLPDPPPPSFGGSGFQLVIDKLAVTAPVTTLGMDEELVPKVPQTAGEVAWYDFSAVPGTGSNAVFAGHVTWNGPAVFYKLNQLQAGDQIRLVGNDGTQLTYNVTAVFEVDPEDPASLKVMWSTEQDVITLITCSGTFFETDDPVAGGDYTHRLIVRAHLSGVGQPSAAGG